MQVQAGSTQPAQGPEQPFISSVRLFYDRKKKLLVAQVHGVPPPQAEMRFVFVKDGRTQVETMENKIPLAQFDQTPYGEFQVTVCTGNQAVTSNILRMNRKTTERRVVVHNVASTQLRNLPDTPEPQAVKPELTQQSACSQTVVRRKKEQPLLSTWVVSNSESVEQPVCDPVDEPPIKPRYHRVVHVAPAAPQRVRKQKPRKSAHSAAPATPEISRRRAPEPITPYYAAVQEITGENYELELRVNYDPCDEPVFILMNQYRGDEYKVSETDVAVNKITYGYTLTFCFTAADIGAFAYMLVDYGAHKYFLPLTTAPVLPGPDYVEVCEQLETAGAAVNMALVDMATGRLTAATLTVDGDEVYATAPDGRVICSYTEEVRYIDIVTPAQLASLPEHFATAESLAARSWLQIYAAELEHHRPGCFFNDDFYDEVQRLDPMNRIPNDPDHYLIVRSGARPEVMAFQCREDRDTAFLMLMMAAGRIHASSDFSAPNRHFIDTYSHQAEGYDDPYDFSPDHNTVLRTVSTPQVLLDEPLDLVLDEQGATFGDDVKAFLCGFKSYGVSYSQRYYTGDVLGYDFAFSGVKVFCGDFLRNQVVVLADNKLDPPGYVTPEELVADAVVVKLNGDEVKVQVLVQDGMFRIKGEEYATEWEDIFKCPIFIGPINYVAYRVGNEYGDGAIWNICLETDDWLALVDIMEL